MPVPEAVSRSYPDDLDPKILGERIRHARMTDPETGEPTGRTQMQLVVALGVWPSTVSSWERGAHRPHSRELDQIVEITGWSWDYFLGLAER